MQIGRLTNHPEPTVASSPELWERSPIADAVSASGGQEAAEGGRADEASRLGEAATGPHPSAGNGVDFLDSCRSLHSVQRKHSMSNFKGHGPNSSPATSSDCRVPMHASESSSRKSQLPRGPCTVRPCFVRGPRDPHARE